MTAADATRSTGNIPRRCHSLRILQMAREGKVRAVNCREHQ
jgi:hypothetical protein